MDKKKKVLYIGEVPIEPLPGGALLLYRAFKLIDLEPDVVYFNYVSKKENVINLKYPFDRAQRTRFVKIYNFINFYFLWKVIYFKLKKQIHNYSKIVAVSHGVGYKVATKLAHNNNIQLISIHHDLYENTFPTLGKAYVRKWFLRSINYKYARNLFVSDYMREKMNPNADLLLPFRDHSVNHKWDEFKEKSGDKNKLEKNLVYAGSAHSVTYVPIILNISNVLKNIGWKVTIFSNLREKDFLAFCPQIPENIDVCDFISNQDLIEYINTKASAMLLIQSFEDIHREGQSTNFPSKLTDYTIPGIPIIFVGPEYASGIKWYNSLTNNIGEWINDVSEDSIAKKLLPLFSNEEELKRRGENAKIEGKKYFSAQNYYELLTQVFYER